MDGVLRVFAETRLLLWLNLMRLGIIAGLIQLSLARFSLIGPVLVILLATFAFKAGALIRMKRLFRTGAAGLLPWRSLAAILGCSAAAAVVAMVVKSRLHAPVASCFSRLVRSMSSCMRCWFGISIC